MKGVIPPLLATTQTFTPERKPAMTLTKIFFGLVVLLALHAATTTAIGTATAADPIAATKTYKRRCTNYKCKIVTESTKPYFKCPHCGSSTVPVK